MLSINICFNFMPKKYLEKNALLVVCNLCVFAGTRTINPLPHPSYSSRYVFFRLHQAEKMLRMDGARQRTLL